MPRVTSRPGSTPEKTSMSIAHREHASTSELLRTTRTYATTTRRSSGSNHAGTPRTCLERGKSSCDCLGIDSITSKEATARKFVLMWHRIPSPLISFTFSSDRSGRSTGSSTGNVFQGQSPFSPGTGFILLQTVQPSTFFPSKKRWIGRYSRKAITEIVIPLKMLNGTKVMKITSSFESIVTTVFALLHMSMIAGSGKPITFS